MKVTYNPATDVMRIVFRDSPIDDYNEDRPGIKVDYDVDDQLVAIEIQNASEMVDDPMVVEHQIVDA
jgi:uncharacterized protein YuzE